MQVRDKHKDRKSFGALAVFCFVLQLALAPYIALGEGRANVALVFAGIVALSHGGRPGVLAGFVSGLVFDLCTTGPIGLMALLLTVLSFFLGMEERNRLADEPAGSFVLFAISSLIVVAVYHFAMLLVGDSGSLVDVLVARTLPTYVLTLIFYIGIAFLHSWGSSGTPSFGTPGKSKGTSGLGKGGHYKLGKM